MGFRNVKQSLQDIVEIKEAEQKEKERQQKDIAELEELKAKIKICIEAELVEIAKDGENNLLLYYYNNKIDIAKSVYTRLLNSDKKIIKDAEAEKYPPLAPPLEAYYFDSNRTLKPIYIQIPRYNEEEYNKDKMLVLIDTLI